MPEPIEPIDPILAAAIDKIAGFVTATTGTIPSPKEIAGALTKYFVMKEIKEHIEMERESQRKSDAGGDDP